jgi:hypothetical protein
LILIVGLIALGWQKSFKQWTEEWRGAHQPKSMPVHRTTAVDPTGVNVTAVNTPVPRQPFINAGYARTAPRPQPTISNGQWMWDPNHRSALDQPPPEKQASSGYYLDAAGRKYWIDSHGYRHYEGSGSTP